MTDQPTLITCPGCYGPLAPDDARRRLVNGSCTGCRVEAPDVKPGEILYCSRTGRELEEQDFRTGRAIRLYKRCISLDAIRDERAKMKENGEYGCDSCGARLTPLDFLSGEAQIVDKVILCVRCRRKKPDPAGNGRKPSRSERSERKAAARPDEAISAGMKAAKKRPSESTSEGMRAAKKREPEVEEPDFTPAVVSASPGPSELVGSGDQVMIGGVGMRDMVRASMTMEPEAGAEPAPPTQPSPVVSASSSPSPSPSPSVRGPGREPQPERIERQKSDRLPVPEVVEFAPATPSPPQAAGPAPAPAMAAATPAMRAPFNRKAAPTHHRAGAVQTVDGVTIELATSRDLRWAAGAMVLMVLVLCVVLIIVFLNFQKVDPELNARLKLLSENLRSMQSDISTLRLQQDSLQRDLDVLRRQGSGPQPAGGPGPGISPPVNVGRDPRANRPDPAIERQPRNNANPGTNNGIGGNNGASGNTPGNEPAVPRNPREDDVPRLDPDDPLAVALESRDPAIRLNAVLDANRTYNRKAIPHLMAMVERESDPYVRAFAIRLLATFRVTEARPALEAIAARRADDIVNDAATEALRALQ